MSVNIPGSVRADSSVLERTINAARAQLIRLTPHELQTVAEHAVILDTRTPTDRALYGCIPGSWHTPRTVLEWRVALDAPVRLAAITTTDQLLVVVCNEGCSSSLAAAALQQLGFPRATDLIGGVEAWAKAGLPLVPPTNDEIGIQACH